MDYHVKAAQVRWDKEKKEAKEKENEEKYYEEQLKLNEHDWANNVD